MCNVLNSSFKGSLPSESASYYRTLLDLELELFNFFSSIQDHWTVNSLHLIITDKDIILIYLGPLEAYDIVVTK